VCGCLPPFRQQADLVERSSPICWQVGRRSTATWPDDKPYGRFTGAYVRAAFADHALGMRSLGAPVGLMIAEPALRQLWSDWLDARLLDHQARTAHPAEDRRSRPMASGSDLLQPTPAGRDLTGLRSRY
jgi:hypothetical protein